MKKTRDVLQAAAAYNATQLLSPTRNCHCRVGAEERLDGHSLALSRYGSLLSFYLEFFFLHFYHRLAFSACRINFITMMMIIILQRAARSRVCGFVSTFLSS